MGHPASGVESLADVLFSGFDVWLTRVTEAAEGLVVEAVACGPPLRCPGCNSQAARVHSSYELGLAGLPVNGRSLTVRLPDRGSFCDRGRCPRRSFAGTSARAPGRLSVASDAWSVAGHVRGKPRTRKQAIPIQRAA